MCTKQITGIRNQNPEMNEVLQSGRISCTVSRCIWDSDSWKEEAKKTVKWGLFRSHITSSRGENKLIDSPNIATAVQGKQYPEENPDLPVQKGRAEAKNAWIPTVIIIAICCCKPESQLHRVSRGLHPLLFPPVSFFAN